MIEKLAIAEVELAGQALQDCIGWLAYMLVALACAACKSAVFPCSSAVKAKAITAKALFGVPISELLYEFRMGNPQVQQ